MADVGRGPRKSSAREAGQHSARTPVGQTGVLAHHGPPPPHARTAKGTDRATRCTARRQFAWNSFRAPSTSLGVRSCTSRSTVPWWPSPVASRMDPGMGRAALDGHTDRGLKRAVRESCPAATGHRRLRHPCALVAGSSRSARRRRPTGHGPPDSMVGLCARSPPSRRGTAISSPNRRGREAAVSGAVIELGQRRSSCTHLS